MIIITEILWILLAVNFSNCHIFSQSLSESEKFTDGFQLVSAHVINRHGDHNIDETYPNDPYKDEKFWQNEFGALSNIGKREQYELGKYLRTRYLKIIGDKSAFSKMRIQSSDIDRNLMSAQCTAAGLLPPTANEMLSYNVKWQPMSIHTTTLEDDNLLYSRATCPHFQMMLNDCFETEEVQFILEEHATFLKSLEKYSGQLFPSPAEISYLYDVLSIEDRRGFVLPDWANETLKLNDTLNYLSAVGYYCLTCTNEMKKLRAGFLIKEMLDNFKEEIASIQPSKKPLKIYVTQADILVSVLSALNLFDMRVPPFSSTILFELYERENEFYVQITYRKTVSEDALPLEIPNCGTMCPLKKFYELYDHILPKESEDFTTLCKLKAKSYHPIILILFMNAIAIIVIVMIVLSIKRRNKVVPKKSRSENIRSHSLRSHSLSAIPKHVLDTISENVMPKGVVLPRKNTPQKGFLVYTR